MSSWFSRSKAVLFLCKLAVIGLSAAAMAHSPHDHIEAFELGPTGDHPDGSEYVMLIVVRGNLWRSVDAGASWKRIVRGLDNREALVRLAFEAPEWSLSTEGSAVFHSTDDGWSWQRAVEKTELPRNREADSLAPSVEGLTGQPITSVLRRDETQSFAVRWSEGVYLSKDGGKTWERRAKGLTTDQQGDRRGLPQFTTLREAPDGSGTLFLAGYDGLFRSGNDGETWEQIETLPETLLIDFAISPAYQEDGELVAITYWKGAFHSSDRGETWRPITGNIAPSLWDHLKKKLKGDDEYAQIARFHSITFSPDYANDRTLYAGLRNWFLISDNGGRHWREIELTQFAEGEDVIPDRIVFSDRFAEDGTLFFCSRLGEGKTRRGGVFKSTDRGRTFALVHEAEGKYMQSLAISPRFSNDGTILVSSARGDGNSEVFRSIDGGAIWKSVTGDLQFVEFGAELAFSSEDMIWAGTEQGLWRSDDKGDSWSRLKTGAFPEDGFVDTVATISVGNFPAGMEPEPIIVTVKGEGMFASRGGVFFPYLSELFAGNHQFNRLWSYSPGALIKIPADRSNSNVFFMTGEDFFRIGNDGTEELPVRAVAAIQGEVSLTGFWIAVAAAVSGLFFGGWIFIRQRFLKRSQPAK